VPFAERVPRAAGGAPWRWRPARRRCHDVEAWSAIV